MRTVDLRTRIAEHLPAEVPVTGDQGIALGDVAAGRKSMEQFVAQLSDEELEALTRGHGRMNSRLAPPATLACSAGFWRRSAPRGCRRSPAPTGPRASG